MKTIIMKSTSSGPDGVKLAGKPYSVEDAIAKQLVDGGYAEYEKAVVSDVEIAGKSPDIEKVKKAAEAVKPATKPAWTTK